MITCSCCSAQFNPLIGGIIRPEPTCDMCVTHWDEDDVSAS